MPSPGAVDGYCVGEPWNTVAEASGAGVIVTTKASIWQIESRKRFWDFARWAEENPEVLVKLLLGLHQSAKWCASPDNREELARILALPHIHWSCTREDVAVASRAVCRRKQDDFLLLPSAPRIFRGRATRCGSTRRWCAGGRFGTPLPVPMAAAAPTGQISIARPWVMGSRCPAPAPKSKVRARKRHHVPALAVAWRLAPMAFSSGVLRSRPD